MFSLDDIVHIERESSVQLKVIGDNFISYFLTRENPSKNTLTVRELIGEVFTNNNDRYYLDILNKPYRIKIIIKAIEDRPKFSQESKKVWAF